MRAHEQHITGAHYPPPPQPTHLLLLRQRQPLRQALQPVHRGLLLLLRRCQLATHCSKGGGM